jgi:hypothetical protein
VQLPLRPGDNLNYVAVKQLAAVLGMAHSPESLIHSAEALTECSGWLQREQNDGPPLTVSRKMRGIPTLGLLQERQNRAIERRRVIHIRHMPGIGNRHIARSE